MRQNTHDIVGLGVIAVDEMLYVDSYPPADGKKFLSGRRRQGGGNTSCALAAAARLGSRCAILGRLGDDELSQFAREHLVRAGVDLSFVLHDPSCGPIYALIVVSADTGARAIFVDPASVRPLEYEELRADWLQGAQVLMVDHLYPAAILPAVRMARQLGLQVVSDIETDMPQLAEIRAGIDHFICSAEFALPFTGRADPREACEMLRRSAPHQTVVVTAGGDGCYWCSGAESAVTHLPAHRIEPVDTTGCGDVFHGAFCHGLAAGWSVERIIRFANAAAAVKATRTGGWAAVPTKEEVQQLLQESPW
jgi:sulfofructose kinase